MARGGAEHLPRAIRGIGRVVFILSTGGGGRGGGGGMVVFFVFPAGSKSLRGLPGVRILGDSGFLGRVPATPPG
eukprot:4073088-Pyramimonas_sp.AAC.1